MDGAEVWDVTDASGTPTGATRVRGAPDWPAGRFHVVAATCVVDADGRMLLSRRAAAKDFPGTWEFPGGSALAGESSAEAAARELREETGLRGSPGAMRWVERFREETALFDLFLVPLPDGQHPSPDLVEVSEVAWADPAEVARRRRAGAFAGPWEHRLRAFWGPLLEALEARSR